MDNEEPCHHASNKRQKTQEDSPQEPKETGKGQESDQKEKEGDDEDTGAENESDASYETEDSDVDCFFQARARLLEIQERYQAKQDDASEEDDERESDSDESDFGGEEFAVRVQMINHAVNEPFQAKEVGGTHRTGCDDCGTVPSYGESYAVDQSNGVWDAPKLCEECVQRRSDLLLNISQDIHRYLKLQRIRQKLEANRIFVLSPFARGGLFEVGPDAPFCLCEGILGGAPKTFKEHMVKAGTKQWNAYSINALKSLSW